jgi:hypothetical protein
MGVDEREPHGATIYSGTLDFGPNTCLDGADTDPDEESSTKVLYAYFPSVACCNSAARKFDRGALPVVDVTLGPQ